MKHSLRTAALCLLFAPLVPVINLLGVLVQFRGYWGPLVASGRMTFLQAINVEWIWYYKGHRYGSILASDMPGLALFLFLIMFRSYHVWSRRRARDGFGAKPDSLVVRENVWPPPPTV